MLLSAGATSRSRFPACLLGGVLLLAAFLTLGFEPADARVKSDAPWQPEFWQSGGEALQLKESVQRSLAGKLRPMLDHGAGTEQLARLQGVKAPASLNAVVMMCDFSDSLLYGRYEMQPGEMPHEFFYSAHDSVYFHHLMADAAAYWDVVSDGQFTLDFTIVATVAELPHPMSFYGNHPERGEQSVRLAADVVAALDGEVDFNAFDTVIVVHAGAGEETDIGNNSPEQIYSTFLDREDFESAFQDTILPQPYIETADGAELRNVLILPETEFQDPMGGFQGYFGSLGVYCFEIGQRLGMISLSDPTPSGGPDSQGIGQFGLMGYGLYAAGGFIPPHPCAFNKLLMGWIDPVIVDPDDELTTILNPAEHCSAPNSMARVNITDQEYWLLEFRLQDPNGDGDFSWSNDLNGDHYPSFTDIATHTFEPMWFVDMFDPELHVHETMTDGEFDFAMSENDARPAGVTCAGSGLYIWHIDEGVIRDAFLNDTGLYNANADRKAVDLEEADGIQDLDSLYPSSYILGGDDDSFRGEDNSVFGPDTLPSTRTAGGIWTGIIFDNISDVVSDTLVFDPINDDFDIDYHTEMSFRCRRLAPAAGGPGQPQQVELPGVDLTGSHLLAVDLDGDALQEIVAVGSAGEVFALMGDLDELVDDGDPEVVTPLAVGTNALGEPVDWLGPPAAGDLDGDGLPEIVVATREGVYAFHGNDGSPVIGGAAVGLLAAVDECVTAPVLLATGPIATYSPMTQTVVCVVQQTGSGAALLFIDDAGAEAWPAISLGSVVVSSPPLDMAGTLAVAVRDTVAEESRLVLVDWTPAESDPAIRVEIDLTVVPGALPLVGGSYGGLSPSENPVQPCVVVVGRSGQAEAVWFEDATVTHRVLWPEEFSVTTPLAPSVLSTVGKSAAAPALVVPHQGLAFGAGATFRTGTVSGTPHSGWPVTPLPAVFEATLDRAPSPLRMGTYSGTEAYLFTANDGRVYLYDVDGELQDGWPAAGPGPVAGTPLLADLDDDGDFELVSVGCAHQITGVIADSDSLLTEVHSRIAVWQDVIDPGAIDDRFGWLMWGGTPWRGAGLPPTTGSTGVSSPMVANSYSCYPNPLTEGDLHVRAEALIAGSARVTIYNLEGEEVCQAGPEPVFAGEYFEVLVPLSGVASGLYLCKLEVSGRSSTDTSVLPVAIAR